ncbi:trimethyllysine dioxygenase TmlH [Aspergillus heteromorphus CBS 117.55]|uniref:Trimethyllysine dioxygenase n=1 Tax=Aspergillus heteromorphus CBS 117.55 TaxID=1448321 RepID=A0A317VWI3_9EURO|nr:trimethyllysine dioxygenase TmlH [Aspergillus heteromorphus CBS 117.55]PWY76290.1 trimethyllysine dioxygenase TmlH [Aspergillus heteromorphus CBS 117.55]
MSDPGVGHEFPPQEVSWHKRDVLIFANSIGCKADELHFLYELHPNFAVFPTYPVILPFKLTDQEVTDFYARSGGAPIPGVPKFDYRRVVDGQRKLTVLKPLPPTSAGKQFELRNKVVGVYDKGKSGTVVETEQAIVEKGTGEVYSKTVSSGFFVGQGNWGPNTVNYAPPEGKKPDAVHITQTSMETAHLYRLNGDYNPLHATPEPGEKMGFGGAILHGLFSWNSAAHGILRELGGSDPKNLREFQARFASPVRPGDRLTTEIWRTGNLQDGYEEVLFVTKNEKGKAECRTLHFASSFTPRCIRSRCEMARGLPRRFAPVRAQSSVATDPQESPSDEKDGAEGNEWEEEHSVRVQIGKKENSIRSFGTFWLRDNCRCPQCIHPDTRQRMGDTFAIPPDVRPLEITRTKTENSESIDIKWSDGHLATYPPKFLLRHSNMKSGVSKRFPFLSFRPFKTFNPRLRRSKLPMVKYDAVMKEDKAMYDWLHRIYKEGFCFVTDVPRDPRSTKKLLERIAFVRETHYGGFWDFTADLSFKDTAYTNEFLGAHTDNTYFTDPARLQLFHLLHHDGEGGKNLLVDGFHAATVLREENPEHSRILMETNIPAHASGNEGMCIQPAEPEPVLKAHPVLKRLYQIRWNNYDRAPNNNWNVKEQVEWYAAARHWNEILERENMKIWNTLRPGTALIFDNWRMLHGRTEFTGKRRMCGGYINNDDFISRYRSLKYGTERVRDWVGNYSLVRSNPNWLL